MKISIQSLSLSEGKLLIEPTLDTKHIMYQLIQEFKTAKKPYVAEIDKVKNKRSLDSNAYAWALITEIANRLRSGKEEVYFNMLKKYGQSQVVSVIKQGVEVLKRSIKYCEEFGTATLNGKEFVHIKVFTGSSEFSTKEMGIFIDGIISDAKELDIEVMTPNELAKLNSSWGIK